MKMVELVGGPFDGEVHAIEDRVKRMALLIITFRN